MHPRVRSLATIALAAVLTFPLATASTTPALAATDTTVPSWEAAQQVTGSSGSLWKPTFTAGLPLKGRITVVDGTQGDGSRAMAVRAVYGKGKRAFTIMENYQGTFSALDMDPNRAAFLVDRPRIDVGSPDMSYTVRAAISANCYNVEPRADGSIPEPPAGFRCSRQDVARFGGTLTVTMRPATTMTAPGTTFVSIQTSPGITYRQLIRMVQGLVQVGP